MTSAALVFDEGPGRGMGHQKRMEALAAALADRTIACELLPNAERAMARVVVVDSYRFRADDRERFRGDIVVAIDDCRRGLAVDLLVDPSPGSEAAQHDAAGRVLAGARYALVDSRLAGLAVRPTPERVSIVVVATGAADRDGGGQVIAEALVEAEPLLTVQLVLGPWGCEWEPPGVDVVRTRDGLGSVLAGADLVVTGGGVTMLEALSLGRPTVAIVLAENQRLAVEAAAAAGAVLVATIETASLRVLSAVGDPALRSSLARAGSGLVDGKGAQRVADEIAGLIAGAGAPG